MNPKGTTSKSSHATFSTRLRRKAKMRDLSTVPGVYPLLLSSLTQKIIGCVVGDHINTENPWLFVKKELIQDNLELHHESSDFLPLRDAIVNYPGDEILIGYIPELSKEETQDSDQFYVCSTQRAADKIKEILQKRKRKQESKVLSSIFRQGKVWKDLGSADELTEMISKANRSLLEVEVERVFPWTKSNVRLKFRRAVDTRDGYMEVGVNGDKSLNIRMRRVDQSVQVASATREMCNQTTIHYAYNIAIQYKYEFDLKDYPFKTVAEDFSKFCENQLDFVLDALHTTGEINMYSNDFQKLQANNVPMKVISETSLLNFMDVYLCHDKMVVDAKWHPKGMSTVAICYADWALTMNKKTKLTTDSSYRTTFLPNRVLVWNTKKHLKPELVLEAPREVLCVSYCPSNPNIIVGGCRNGQVIVWDVQHTMETLNAVELLTPQQQVYRYVLKNMMLWMKDIQSSFVRPTAVSTLRHSHTGPVTKIQWIISSHQIGKNGKISRTIDNKPSMEFFTSSEDGTILLWDLTQNPSYSDRGIHVRKNRRLQVRPSGLQLAVSPFRMLHLNLKPIFKIYVRTSAKKLLPITGFFADAKTMSTTPFKIVFEQKAMAAQSRTRLVASSSRTVLNVEGQTGHFGTVVGSYGYFSWSGHDFETGEEVTSEECSYCSYVAIHDGPITTVSKNLVSGLILTVGGRVFGLWKENLQRRPWLWRRSSASTYTCGQWIDLHPMMLILSRFDGDRELWILNLSTKNYISLVTCTSNCITKVTIPDPRSRPYTIAYGDSSGIFRCFTLPPVMHQMKRIQAEFLNAKVNRDIRKKQRFLAWQEKWLLGHPTEEVEEEVVEESVKEEVKEVKESEINKDHIFIMREIERYKQVLLQRKQVNMVEMMDKRKAVIKEMEDRQRRQRKFNDKMKNAEKNFKETVAALFPNYGKTEVAVGGDAYAGGDSVTLKEAIYDDYMELESKYKEYVATHPYIDDISLKDIYLKLGSPYKVHNVMQVKRSRTRVSNKVATTPRTTL